jgi:hypothetical protein
VSAMGRFGVLQSCSSFVLVVDCSPHEQNDHEDDPSIAIHF